MRRLLVLTGLLLGAVLTAGSSSDPALCEELVNVVREYQAAKDRHHDASMDRLAEIVGRPNTTHAVRPLPPKETVDDGDQTSRWNLAIALSLAVLAIFALLLIAT